jgi:hypothetical protein
MQISAGQLVLLQWLSDVHSMVPEVLYSTSTTLPSMSMSRWNVPAETLHSMPEGDAPGQDTSESPAVRVWLSEMWSGAMQSASRAATTATSEGERGRGRGVSWIPILLVSLVGGCTRRWSSHLLACCLFNSRTHGQCRNKKDLYTPRGVCKTTAAAAPPALCSLGQLPPWFHTRRTGRMWQHGNIRMQEQPPAGQLTRRIFPSIWLCLDRDERAEQGK